MAKKMQLWKGFSLNLFRFALHVAIRKIFATFPKNHYRFPNGQKTVVH